MAGSSAVEQTQIDQWIGWTNTTLAPTCDAVLGGIFGSDQIYQAHWNDANKDLKA